MPRVLIIDDDADLLTVLTSAFRRAGFETFFAGDGRSGLNLFASVKPDLVITDIIMPEMEGIGVILELRRARRPTKVIAISGGGRFGCGSTLTWATHLGADFIAAKPFRASDLVARARELLGLEGPAGTLERAADQIAS
jgi:DNA-binding response OmpR family regulator